ncbi:MAG: sulfatase-like hydrolase/transferase [Crocinitomicaceae bacterium]
MRYFILFLVVSYLSVTTYSQDEQRYKAENVIILVMDGPRYSETWGDSTHQYIPRMANDMAPQGVIYTSFYQNGPTYTTAGHTAICTGVYQKMKNNGKQLPKNPSIFQYWLEHSKKPKTSAYVITSKDKLAILTNCKKRKWRGKYRPAQNCGVDGLFSGYRRDAETYTETIRILNEYKPNLVMVNFRQPDAWGHTGNWEKYLSSLKETDEYVYKIFRYIQSNAHYKDKTALFVTNDHGRHLDGHKDGFVSHGGGCEGCRHINCFAYGPDFKQNLITSKERELIDIPVTISKIMGFEMDCVKGDVMTELFK